MIKELKEENFSEFISSNNIVLIDFSATWCGPCKVQGKILEDIAAKYGDKIAIAKVDVDENPRIAEEFHIYAVPSLVFFVKGKLVVFDESSEKTVEPVEESKEFLIESSKLVGVQSEGKLKMIIENLISNIHSNELKTRSEF